MIFQKVFMRDIETLKNSEKSDEDSHKGKIVGLLSVSHLAEKLKDELRHQWTSANRQESVAEHSWRLALMLILCCPYINHPIDFRKAITMAVIHDLVEAEAGDQFF